MLEFNRLEYLIQVRVLSKHGSSQGYLGMYYGPIEPANWYEEWDLVLRGGDAVWFDTLEEARRTRKRLAANIHKTDFQEFDEIYRFRIVTRVK